MILLKKIIKSFTESEMYFNFKKNRSAQLGMLIVIFFLVVTIIGPFLTFQNPYDLKSLDLDDAYQPPSFIDKDSKFFLGTDQQGRDILSSIVYGCRISIFVGIAGSVFSLVLGTCLGIIAGYNGGIIDTIIMRIVDIHLSFPTMLIALFIMAAFGKGTDKIIFALILVGWVSYARTVRGLTLSEKNKEYIEAAKLCGYPKGAIMFKQLLPNVITPLVVIFTIQVGDFILTEATLSFLGLGVPITKPSLGLLISNGYEVLFSGLWWVSVFPGLALMLLVFGINLLGDFFRDELDPNLK